MQKKVIIFIIPSLVTGGAERIMAHIIRNLDKSRYDIFLILFEKKGPNLNYIPEYVNLYNLEKKNKLSFLNLILKLSQLFSKIKPNVVFCFLIILTINKLN